MDATVEERPRRDLTVHYATELAVLVRAREVSPLEVTRAFLERIERLDPRLGAFTLVTAERALADAAARERRILAGEPAGPLEGVPVAVKELSSTAGIRSTFASRAFADYVPDQDDEAIARLFRAGAPLLGRTNSPEFGLNAATEDDNGLFPPTRNPWDPTRSAGGSSGGASAAVAARLCPLAQGDDGGGSVRIPAACCGVVGLKPSRGRISYAPYDGEGWSGLATAGPLARTVADVALALDVMAGPATGDRYPTPNPERTFASAVGDELPSLRVGWTARNPETDVHPEVAAAVERTAATLAGFGHAVEEVAPDLIAPSGLCETFGKIIAAHTGATELADPDLLGRIARGFYDRGRALSASDFLHARSTLYHQTRSIALALERYDVLLCPPLPEPVLPLGTLNEDEPLGPRLRRFMPFTYWVNCTGQPAISLPLAWSSSGLPIGVQLVGRPLGERAILSLAARLEEAVRWRDREPPLAA